jgi:hypothetical protein
MMEVLLLTMLVALVLAVATRSASARRAPVRVLVPISRQRITRRR